MTSNLGHRCVETYVCVTFCLDWKNSGVCPLENTLICPENPVLSKEETKSLDMARITLVLG